MRPEFPSEDIENLLADPATFGEGGEREVVRVDLAQTCTLTDRDKQTRVEMKVNH